MVFLAGLHEDRDFHLLQVEPVAAQFQLALGQCIVLVELLQIIEVERLGHARLVGIPVEKVKGLRRLAEQIVVDDKRPDQIVGAQHVERVGHGAPVQHAALRIHQPADFLEPFLVDENE